jgi:hypothetical protein
MYGHSAIHQTNTVHDVQMVDGYDFALDRWHWLEMLPRMDTTNAKILLLKMAVAVVASSHDRNGGDRRRIRVVGTVMMMMMTMLQQANLQLLKFDYQFEL